jgi:hypothetical protein
MAKLLSNPRIQLTKLDRLAFDPEKGAFNDIGWWAKLYFDGQVFPWQQHAHRGIRLEAGSSRSRRHFRLYGLVSYSSLVGGT